MDDFYEITEEELKKLAATRTIADMNNFIGVLKNNHEDIQEIIENNTEEGR